MQGIRCSRSYQDRSAESLLKRPLIFPFFGAVVALGVCAAYIGTADDARTHPLEGHWRATFAIDTSTRAEAPAGRVANGTVTLRAGEAVYPWMRVFWQRSFRGDYVVPFAATFGHDLPAADPRALAVRRGRDSVELYLGQLCCDAGGLRGRGVVRVDTVLGVWNLDLDGNLVRGSFRLERDGGPR